MRDPGGFDLRPHQFRRAQVEYTVEIEADAYGVTVMVARDAHDVPYGSAVAFGDEPSGLGTVLALCDIEFPGDVPDSPPDWVA